MTSLEFYRLLRPSIVYHPPLLWYLLHMAQQPTVHRLVRDRLADVKPAERETASCRSGALVRSTTRCWTWSLTSACPFWDEPLRGVEKGSRALPRTKCTMGGGSSSLDVGTQLSRSRHRMSVFGSTHRTISTKGPVLACLCSGRMDRSFRGLGLDSQSGRACGLAKALTQWSGLAKSTLLLAN